MGRKGTEAPASAEASVGEEHKEGLPLWTEDIQTLRTSISMSKKKKKH